MAQTSLEDVRNDLLAKLRETNPNPVLYELGSGVTPHEDFIGLDLYADHPRVKKVDLYATPWDIADNSVDYYRSSHFVEHVPDWNAHFAEVYRTLKPGGHYEIIAPFYANRRFFQDPSHKNAILEEKFAYLSREWRKFVNLSHSGDYPDVDFDRIAWFELLHEDFVGVSDDSLAYAKKHLWNVVEDIAIVLVKKGMGEQEAA